MHGINKRNLRHGLMDFILIILAVQYSDVGPHLFPRYDRGVSSYQGSDDDGPLLVIQTSAHSSLDSQSRKSFIRPYDPILDEYDRIMQDVRSQSPVGHVADTEYSVEDLTFTTMVLGMSDSSNPLSQGGLQVSRHYPVDGAVGGFGQPFVNDENFDIFSNFMPGNMREDDINDLISGDEVSSLDQSFPDINWQQFIADYDSFLQGTSGFSKSQPDLLSEAIQSSELFLPLPANSQNLTEFDPSNTVTETGDDPVVAARLDMMEYSEWASQDHQEDVLFPLLPPPSYEQAVGSQQVNSTSDEESQRIYNTDHLHDHNYFNTSAPPADVKDSTSTSAQTASYAIRSRHEVSTRVISIPARPRHISISAESSSSSTMSETVDCHEESDTERATSHTDISAGLNEALQQPNTFDSFVIKPLDLTYFNNISRAIGTRREVILCN